MGNERRIRTLKIALASYDRKELRVQKHYLEEEDPSIDCECFQSGSRMLQALQSGHVFDIIILCSEMEDMTGLEFLMHARRLTPPPMVLMFDEGRRHNDSALCMDTENGVFYLGQTDLRSLLRQLYRRCGGNEDFFAVSAGDFDAGLAAADMQRSAVHYLRALGEAEKLPEVTAESITTGYPGLGQSVAQVFHNTDERCKTL